jgi:glycosyltransferase involved in cell wall biosynthesis
MSEPLVAVLVPSYNPGQYLRPAVESVLRQSYRNLEVIVIDDGSTDGSIETLADLKDPRLQVIRQTNAGKSVALNRVLEDCRADYYAINDADDLSHPERIVKQVECLQANPEVAAVFCGHELILQERRMAPQFRAKSVEECAQDISAYRMPAHDPTAMWRLSLVSSFRYEPDLPGVEGYDYILRIGEQFPMMVLGECLYSYRVHPTSITQRSPMTRERLVREVLRRAAVRRGTTFEAAFPSMVTEKKRLSNRDRDNNLAAHFIESVLDLRSKGRLMDAIRTGLSCSRFHPTDPHYLKALAYAVLPTAVVQRVRSRRKLSVPR